MITGSLIVVKKKYDEFLSEAEKYPGIINNMDKQLKECLFASLFTSLGLGCNEPRAILPLCAKIRNITQIVYDERKHNRALFLSWKNLLQHMCREGGLTVERRGFPPTKLNFPLSNSILHGANPSFDKISFLDPTDDNILKTIVKECFRLTEQTCGDSIFSETSLEMMLKGKETLCAYATTVEGDVVAVMWGIRLQIPQGNEMVSCFYIFSAAREPEYGGHQIYHKMHQVIQPALGAGGQFQSDFIVWKQAKSNSINQAAIEKYKGDEQSLMRFEAPSYNSVEAEFCIVTQGSKTFPGFEKIIDVMMDYTLEVGSLWTFAKEYPILKFKGFFWPRYYNKEFDVPEGYPTSLQPISLSQATSI